MGNNKVLRDFVGVLLMLLLVAGAAGGGFTAATSGTDSEFIGRAMQNLSEVTNGVIAGDTASTESMANTIMKLAKGIAGGALFVQGTAQVGVSVNEGYVAEAMKNIDLYNQAQEMTRHMIQDGTQFMKQVQSEFTQLFENLNLSAPLDAVT